MMTLTVEWTYLGDGNVDVEVDSTGVRRVVLRNTIAGVYEEDPEIPAGTEIPVADFLADLGSSGARSFWERVAEYQAEARCNPWI